MAVTIKRISEISGVSRGTVDRVLNGRAGVRPETAALVLKVAEELGYKPNRAGMALAARKKSYRIGVLLTAEGVAFFEDVIRGVRAAEAELAEYDVAVELRSIKGYDAAVQLSAIEWLLPDIHALILNPIGDGRIRQKLEELEQSGIPVIAVNTDIASIPRPCYVGPDYYRNGRAAGGMMRLLLPAGARAVAIFGGSREMIGHRRRIAGFTDVLAAHRPDCHVVDRQFTEDDDIIAYEKATRCFSTYPGLDGVYIAAAGTYGVCRAVLSAFPGRKPAIVCSDLIPATTGLLREGLIQAAICQQPFRQGYESVRRIFDYLLSSHKPEDFLAGDEIMIAENAPGEG